MSRPLAVNYGWQYEPKFLARALRRQGIAALHFSDDGSDLEGANPLAPRTFLGEKTVRRFRIEAWDHHLWLNHEPFDRANWRAEGPRGRE